MTFYIFTLVRAVDKQGKPLPETSFEAGLKEIRQLNVWDERSHARLMGDYSHYGYVTVEKLGYQRSAGKPLERKGQITVVAPFLVAIENDIKHTIKQPGGPKDFLERVEGSDE